MGIKECMSNKSWGFDDLLFLFAHFLLNLIKHDTQNSFTI